MKTVSFVNMKGGVSKTTLAVNIADCLNRRHDSNVLLVDLDPQFNATQCLFSGEEYVENRKNGKHTIFSIFDDVGQTGKSLVSGETSSKNVKLEDIKPWEIREGFDLIPGDLELYRLDGTAGQGREQRLKRYLEKSEAANKYEYIIVDTPPTPSSWMMSALIASDYYLIPVKCEPLSRVGIDLLRGIVNRCGENFGHEIECLGVVLTQADRRTINFSETIKWLDKNDVWADKRFKADLPQRTRIARDQGTQGLILDSTIDDAKLALAQITNELIEKLDNG